MEIEVKAYAWTDGSNGTTNGPCGAAAYVIASADTLTVIEERGFDFPHTGGYRFTNSDMEITAIMLCLQAARRIGLDDLVVHSDSEWAVYTITGKFQIKTQKFVSTVHKIWEIADDLDYFAIKHIGRESNQRADWHCRRTTGQSHKARPPALTVPARSGRSRPQRSYS